MKTNCVLCDRFMALSSSDFIKSLLNLFAPSYSGNELMKLLTKDNKNTQNELSGYD